MDFDTSSHPQKISQRLALTHIGSIAYIYLVEVIIVWILLNLSFVGVERFTRFVDGSFVEGTVAWRYLVPALGAASLIHIYWQPHLKRILVFGTVLAILVIWRQ